MQTGRFRCLRTVGQFGWCEKFICWHCDLHVTRKDSGILTHGPHATPHVTREDSGIVNTSSCYVSVGNYMRFLTHSVRSTSAAQFLDLLLFVLIVNKLFKSCSTDNKIWVICKPTGQGAWVRQRFVVFGTYPGRMSFRTIPIQYGWE